MKHLTTYIVVVTLAIILIVSCTKKQDGQSNATPAHHSVAATARQLDGGYVGLALNMNRGAGKKKKNGGQDCGCTRCFGLCFGRVDDGPDESEQRNAILKDLNDGSGTLYVLNQPDDDVSVDATLYVDDDLVMSYGSDSLTILAGQYPYIASPGTVVYHNHTYSYYGTLTVNFQ